MNPRNATAPARLHKARVATAAGDAPALLHRIFEE
jgi:hypothetical protein